MRITEHDIDLIIMTFSVGAAVGSIVTYLNVTREKRTIAAIRRDVKLLAAYHELSSAQDRKAHSTELVNDEQIIVLHRWAVNWCRLLKKDHGIKLHPVRLTAESIIFEELLGLSRVDAPRRLLAASEGRANLHDFPRLLKIVQRQPPPQ